MSGPGRCKAASDQPHVLLPSSLDAESARGAPSPLPSSASSALQFQHYDTAAAAAEAAAAATATPAGMPMIASAGVCSSATGTARWAFDAQPVVHSPADSGALPSAGSVDHGAACCCEDASELRERVAALEELAQVLQQRERDARAELQRLRQARAAAAPPRAAPCSALRPLQHAKQALMSRRRAEQECAALQKENQVLHAEVRGARSVKAVAQH